MIPKHACKTATSEGQWINSLIMAVFSCALAMGLICGTGSTVKGQDLASETGLRAVAATEIASPATGPYADETGFSFPDVTTPPIATQAIATSPPALSGQQSTRITDSLLWWNEGVAQSILPRPNWVTFDLDTVLMDTLQHSPRIQSLTHGTGMTLERIVQQDAAFDPTMLFSTSVGKSNEPVGNTLTTGGADRLREDSSAIRGGFRRNGRRGTEVGLTQELSTLDSNSSFFVPRNQGNARLSLNLTQPLLARSGQVYNERLLMQARIDSRITWQEMRSDVESRIAETMEAYWRLYESRCHLLQQKQLLSRGQRIETILRARGDLDSGRIELAKARQRVARRRDQLIVLDAEVQKRQTRLATLIGSEHLLGTHSQLELIPRETPVVPKQDWQLRDVMVQALENRPEIKSATSQLEAAGLAIRVTRTELVPQLNAVVNASLAALNGRNNAGRSFADQFTFTPGIQAALEYEMPYGRRSAKARHREAFHQYQQRSQDLREIIQETQYEVEAALIDVKRSSLQHQSKYDLLTTAIEEEQILTRRWELMAGDGSRVGVVLENLLDAQQRRADAEREYVTAQAAYMVSLIDIQRAMGTLLMYEGINSVRTGCSSIDFARDATLNLPPADPRQAVVPRQLGHLETSPAVQDQPFQTQVNGSGSDAQNVGPIPWLPPATPESERTTAAPMGAEARSLPSAWESTTTRNNPIPLPRVQ